MLACVTIFAQCCAGDGQNTDFARPLLRPRSSAPELCKAHRATPASFTHVVRVVTPDLSSCSRLAGRHHILPWGLSLADGDVGSEISVWSQAPSHPRVDNLHGVQHTQPFSERRLAKTGCACHAPLQGSRDATKALCRAFPSMFGAVQVRRHVIPARSLRLPEQASAFSSRSTRRGGQTRRLAASSRLGAFPGLWPALVTRKAV